MEEWIEITPMSIRKSKRDYVSSHVEEWIEIPSQGGDRGAGTRSPPMWRSGLKYNYKTFGDRGDHRLLPCGGVD